jgi:SAM-dependent methyltransferase
MGVWKVKKYCHSCVDRNPYLLSLVVKTSIYLIFILHMSYHQDLKTCYSQQARQFDHSRKRKRPEVEQLLQDLQLIDNPTIVDLGCGSWRLFPIIQEYYKDKEFTYIWVDSAQGMINYAAELYPHATRVCQGMQEYIASVDQQSLNCIIALASVQHISWPKNHAVFFKNCYRALSYSGQAFFINRSRSERFLKKYKKETIKAIFKSLITSFARNDLFIPRKDPQWRENNKVYWRMYHIFGLWEIITKCKLAFFEVEKSGYIMQSWELGNDWRKARNSYLVCRK